MSQPPEEAVRLAPCLTTLVELVVGRRDPPGILARAVLGVLIPASILYGLLLAVIRQAMIPARGGIAQIIGLPAVAAGIAYAAPGVAVYGYVCWEEHPRSLKCAKPPCNCCSPCWPSPDRIFRWEIFQCQRVVP